MSLLELVALCAVAATGLYLLVLGGVAFFAPSRASRFLLGFASSLAAHLLELALRMIAGAAFVLSAHHLWLSVGFSIFGWVLAISAACLLPVPWRWHQRFAEHAVPRALRHLKPIGLVSLLIGAFILAAAVNAGPA